MDDQANNSLQQEQEQDKPDKLVEGGQGGAYRPQPTAQRGKGEHQLPNSAAKSLQRQARRNKRTPGKAKSQTLASSESLSTEAKVGDKNKEKLGKGEAYSPQPRAYQGKGEQQLPNSFPTVRTELAETSLNQKEARKRKGQLTNSSLHGATSAGRQGTQPKLAGGTPAPSNKSTNRRTFGAARAERSSFKETMETNLLLTGWLPTKVS